MIPKLFLQIQTACNTTFLNLTIQQRDRQTKKHTKKLKMKNMNFFTSDMQSVSQIILAVLIEETHIFAPP